MDHTQLATSILTQLLPYLSKAGEEFAKEGGKELWQLIKKPFIKDNKLNVLESFEKDPLNETSQDGVLKLLIQYLNDNLELEKSLSERVQHIIENKQYISGSGKGFQGTFSNNTFSF